VDADDTVYGSGCRFQALTRQSSDSSRTGRSNVFSCIGSGCSKVQGVAALRASRVSGEALGGHHIIVDDVELGAETVKVRSEVDREVAVLFASVCPTP